MIHVDQLTKRYPGGQLAVRDVSFDVAKGEILGFLGPNGAGKTTTMRILTCFLSASGGVATIDGLDVFTQSREVRRRIGYLPESVPLYPEMRVQEYLDYRARLKQVPRARRPRSVDEAMGRCGVGPVRDRIIGQLSKGYRQRVGLADALVHEPPILILDEPTVGLDPAQIRDVRALIKELGRERTVILSTHILPEVEMVCGRVVIIHQGRVVAHGTPAELRGRMRGGRVVHAVIRGDRARVRALLAALPDVDSVEEGSAGEGADADLVEYRVRPRGEQELAEELFRAVAGAGFTLRELRGSTASLEDVFVSLMTREAAEDEAPGAAAASVAA